MKNAMKGLCMLLIALFLLPTLGCKRVPITNRKQLNLLPKSQIMSMSNAAYTDFLTQNPPLPYSDPRAAQVKMVGDRMESAVLDFLKQKNALKRVKDFEWEYRTVDDPTVNAWVMPGGKMVFYTGILPLTKDESGLAVVMGHEMGHAVADHGNERMSQQLLAQLGAVSLAVAMNEKPEFTQNIFLQAYGASSTLGVLKYSRTHEIEADKLGLIFMAIAGYDPAAAVEFWDRMQALSGQAPPEFLSTHPSNETRIAAMKEFLPEARKYYKPR